MKQTENANSTMVMLQKKEVLDLIEAINVMNLALHFSNPEYAEKARLFYEKASVILKAPRDENGYEKPPFVLCAEEPSPDDSRPIEIVSGPIVIVNKRKTIGFEMLGSFSDLPWIIPYRTIALLKLSIPDNCSYVCFKVTDPGP